jgi:hypothetical protein
LLVGSLPDGLLGEQQGPGFSQVGAGSNLMQQVWSLLKKPMGGAACITGFAWLGALFHCSNHSQVLCYALPVVQRQTSVTVVHLSVNFVGVASASAAAAAAAVLQIDASSFKPILLAPALEEIDKIVARDSGIKRSIDKYRWGVHAIVAFAGRNCSSCCQSIGRGSLLWGQVS